MNYVTEYYLALANSIETVCCLLFHHRRTRRVWRLDCNGHVDGYKCTCRQCGRQWIES